MLAEGADTPVVSPGIMAVIMADTTVAITVPTGILDTAPGADRAGATVAMAGGIRDTVTDMVWVLESASA
jgi:hypothetical protein